MFLQVVTDENEDDVIIRSMSDVNAKCRRCNDTKIELRIEHLPSGSRHLVYKRGGCPDCTGGAA